MKSQHNFLRKSSAPPAARTGILLFFTLTLALHAGWAVRPDVARIGYTPKQGEGYESFDEALKDLSDSGRVQELDGISAYELLADGKFQEELFTGLKRDAPKELKEARKSAGNMHNPKMQLLWKPFEKTLPNTTTITKLNASLAVYGLTISGAGVEKFELRSTLTDPKRRFHGLLWLYVTKRSAPAR
jgi:hypothetical protein